MESTINNKFDGDLMKTSLTLILTSIVSICLFAGFAKAQKEMPVQPHENFDSDNFDDPTNMTNEWMNLNPGTRYIYEGTTLGDEKEPLSHRVEIHVTDLTKEIEGINTVVCWDLDYSDEQLVEAELAFFAQDNDGNVWRMGEYPVEYEDGEVIDAPCWISGIEDAVAGISMRGNPEIGSPSYSQGWGPGVGFTDRGQVYQFEPETCVPLDCYDHVLIIRETALSEPNAFQLKYWAKGVGNIRVGWGGGGEKTKEVLELIEIQKLDEEALEAVHTKAFELEKHAYENSKDVYGKTSPLTVR